MTGQLSRPGRAPERVTLSYETDRWDDSGNLSLTLPGGESFTGRYEKVGSVAGAAPAPGLDIDFSTVDWGQAADRWTFGQVGSDSDKVVALLQGNRGRTIRMAEARVQSTMRSGSLDCPWASVKRFRSQASACATIVSR